MGCFCFQVLFSFLRRRQRRDAPPACSEAGGTVATVGHGNEPPLPCRPARSSAPSLSLKPSPSLKPAPPPPLPPFLQLPVEIVVYLCQEYLPPVSAVALSLTCKDLYGLLFTGTKRGLVVDAFGREGLQLLLEKDIGHSWWYCQGCSLLHPISTRGPAGDGMVNGRKVHSFGYDLARPHHSKQFLDGSGFHIDYQSVRLAMNRHFLGPPNGLPLENFEVEAVSASGSLLPWREKWSARIRQDELFLSATRTLSSAGWEDEAFRAALDSEWRQVCGHRRVSTQATQPYCIGALRRPSPTTATIFTPCRDIVESCRRCLADYTTTVEWKWLGKTQPTAYWLITITSYYRLGDGRSHRDPKWEGFGKWETAFACWMERDMAAYPVGAVKAAWDSHESKPAEAAPERGERRRTEPP